MMVFHFVAKDVPFGSVARLVGTFIGFFVEVVECMEELKIPILAV